VRAARPGVPAALDSIADVTLESRLGHVCGSKMQCSCIHNVAEEWVEIEFRGMRSAWRRHACNHCLGALLILAAVAMRKPVAALLICNTQAGQPDIAPAAWSFVWRWLACIGGHAYLCSVLHHPFRASLLHALVPFGAHTCVRFMSATRAGVEAATGGCFSFGRAACAADGVMAVSVMGSGTSSIIRSVLLGRGGVPVQVIRALIVVGGGGGSKLRIPRLLSFRDAPSLSSGV
jgi:hypothetical protein